MQQQPCSSRKFCAKGVRPMRGKRLSIGLMVALSIFTAILFVSCTWAAAQERVLYSFSGGTDGGSPAGGLIFDGAGNLYGTTNGGGTYSGGTVFELSPAAGGGWTETVIHSFGNGTDGNGPEAGLIFDAAGNLYSTTNGGGTYNGGTVFELTPQAGGGWTETVIHSFGSGTDGAGPWAGPNFDAGIGRVLFRSHLQRGDGVRVNAPSGRGLDGDGDTQLR